MTLTRQIARPAIGIIDDRNTEAVVRCYPEPEPEPEPISRLHLACISPEQVRVMRSGVADCICLAAGGRLPKQRARQITQLCIPAP